MSHCAWTASIPIILKGIFVFGFVVATYPSLLEDQYPFPNPTDFYVSLTRKQKFTKVDMS